MSIHLFPILFPFDSVWLCFSFTRFDVPTLIYRYLEKKKKKASTSLVNLPKKLLCCFFISNHHKMLPFYYKNQKWYIRFPFLSVHSNQYAFKCQHLNQLFISFSSYIFKAYVRGARPPPPSRIIKTELNYYLQCMTVLRVPVLWTLNGTMIKLLNILCVFTSQLT